MRFARLLAAAAFLPCLAWLGLSSSASAQTPSLDQTLIAAASLPSAPVPQDAAAPSTQSQGSQPSSTASAPAQSSSSTQTPQAQPPAVQQTQRGKAAEQLKAEEKQRVLGIVPDFSTSYVSDAVSLSAGQKMQLAFRSATDPFTFAAAVLVVGIHEGLDEDSGFGWGAEGFGKRAGAAYLDAFDGDMLGNGILPAILHQDPRYFRLGHGSFHHRLFYAIATSYICKHDNSGRWEPNYSNVGGNIIAGAISNLYYPSENSGWGQTISNGFIVTTEGTLGGVFDEFWPDISRKLFHRDPTNGRDAQAAAQDKARKAAQPVTLAN